MTYQEIYTLFNQTLKELNYSNSYHFVFQIPKQATFGDLSTNLAFLVAKDVNKAPLVVAEELKNKLLENDNQALITSINVAKPGFINIVLAPQYLFKISKIIKDNMNALITKVDSNKTVMFDYGGPNIAKALHIGHLRSAVTGNALYQCFKEKGYQCISDVHLGDWGLPIGMIINEVLHRQITDFTSIDSHVFHGLYSEASQRSKDDETFRKEAEEIVLRLQNGDAQIKAIYEVIREISIEEIEKIYQRINVDFDLWLGESHAQKSIDYLVNKFIEDKIAVEDNDALIIPIAKDDDKKPLPPFILKKSNGASLYSTTDLATIYDRVTNYHPDEIIYVVDFRQGLHFEQVFRTAQMTNLIDDTLKLSFVGFGTINGEDGKPFKTRDGKAPSLEEFINEAKDYYSQSIDNDEVAEKLTLASIKVANFLYDTNKNYIFTKEKFLSSTGKTGAYLLYAYARVNKIIRDFKEDYIIDESTVELPDLLKQQLVCDLEYDNVLQKVIDTYEPSHLCRYLFDVAEGLNKIYDTYRIKEIEQTQTKMIVLEVFELSIQILAHGLNQLGVEVVERM